MAIPHRLKALHDDDAAHRGVGAIAVNVTGLTTNVLAGALATVTAGAAVQITGGMAVDVTAAVVKLNC